MKMMPNRSIIGGSPSACEVGGMACPRIKVPCGTPANLLNAVTKTSSGIRSYFFAMRLLSIFYVPSGI
jgi:hypothetical protein